MIISGSVLDEYLDIFQPLDYQEVMWKESDMCVAYCDLYQGWYRAKISQVSPDGKVSLLKVKIKLLPLKIIFTISRFYLSAVLQKCSST